MINLNLYLAAKNMIDLIDSGFVWRQDEFRKAYRDLKAAVSRVDIKKIETLEKDLPKGSTNLATELMTKIYGPRYCPHCDCVRPVIVHVLDGSEATIAEGNKLTHKFTGAYTCAECFKNINERTSK